MASIKIMALGGLGENGKNMYIVEVNSKIFILDAGMKYPDIDMYGVDSVIPNIDYLINNKHNIQGLFISHGHEDHIGAITYLLKKLPLKVFGTHFTISLIESLLSENYMHVDDYRLFRINDKKVLKFDDVYITFFNTTHSIPESLGICINTQDGKIVYCTDFTFSPAANGTYQTSFDKIIEQDKNVIALLTESINAGAIGRVVNDSLLEHNYNNVLNHSTNRIIVGAYSTDLIRIQKIIDLSIASGRKVGIISRNSKRIVNVAINSEYLKIPEENYIDIFDEDDEALKRLSECNDCVVIVTGYRSEPYASLVRMAMHEDSLISLNEQDKVIIIGAAVPGMERQTTEAINTLFEYNANVEIFDKSILRSSHASPEDLRLLYSMLKPKYIIPIKGEYRHMYEQLQVAIDAGYNRDRIILLDNGEIITFNKGVLENEHSQISVNDVYIDGRSVGVVNEKVIEERTTLAEEGVIILYAVVDLRRRKMVGKIQITTKGFTCSLTEKDLNDSLNGLIERMINNALTKKVWNNEDLTRSVGEELRKYIIRYTKRHPIIVPIIFELK